MSLVRANMQDAAKAAARVLGKDTAFVILAFDEDPDGTPRAHYVSNGKREDIWRAVAEWVLNTPDKPIGND
jgi:hypothetical protein